MPETQTADQIQRAIDTFEAKRRYNEVMALDDARLRAFFLKVRPRDLDLVGPDELLRARRACAAWSFGADEQDLADILDGRIARLHRFHPILRDFP